MFAVITPALITGAIADRMRFSRVGAGSSGCGRSSCTRRSRTGCSRRRLARSSAGALDFAGGTVVHVNAGIAALAAVLVLGQAARLAAAPDAAALAAADADRHRHPLVRLVRVQRRLRARRRTGSPRRRFVNTHLAAAAGDARLARRRADQGPGTPRRSAPRRARSPAWSRSRRARASSAACRRSPIGLSPAGVCASSRSR